MKFLVGLPQTSCDVNRILVIVDGLTKLTHFFPIQSSFSVEWLAHNHVEDVVCFHKVQCLLSLIEVLNSIRSPRGNLRRS